MSDTYHYCAIAQLYPGGPAIYRDGFFVLEKGDMSTTESQQALREHIGAKMDPPQERPCILSLTKVAP